MIIPRKGYMAVRLSCTIMGQQKLLFDENLSISPKTLSGQLHSLLKQRGWTCHSVHEFSDLIGLPDEEIITFAQQHSYALLTLDKRMAYLAVKQGVEVFLVLHEKHAEDTEETEELTVVHLDPFASVKARTSYNARLVSDSKPP